MFFVINAKRPLTMTANDTLEYMADIEKASRLTITDLINNTNLALETTVEELLVGDKLVWELAELTKLNYAYVTASEKIIESLPEELKKKAFALSLYLKLSF